MKKSTALLMVALASMMVSTSALTAFAGPNDLLKTTTEGKVKFKTVDDKDPGEITKPDTDEEIIEIPEGNYTTGPLRLTFVPNFDFEVMKVKSDTIEGNAKFLDFNKKGEVTTTKISHFAQVEDIRGLTNGDWKLTVAASKFKGKKDNKDVELATSAIQFNEAKLFSTSYADVATRVKPMVPATKKEVPNDGTGSLEIMSTIANAGGTNSSKTSLVFNNAYTKDEAITTPAEIATGNPGVTLKSVGKDNKLVDVEYTSILTWTLADTL